jgi:polyether ionophore transport system permease protein
VFLRLCLPHGPRFGRPGGVTELTGTARLVRAILRRDRVRIAVWTLSIAGLVAVTAASVKGLFPTQADLDKAAAAETSAAAIVLNGPPYGLDTVGGQVAYQVGVWGMVAVALMTMFMYTRNTRAEEESGRLELVRATVVGRHAQSTAALIVVGGINLLVGMAVALANIAYGLPVGGSVVFGAGFTVLGLIFCGVTAITTQVSDNTRVANGLAGIVLGLAFALRAIGDVNDGTLSWLSPIGLVQKSRPYAGDVWWPLAIGLVLAGVLTVVGGILASHRDVGAGLTQPRPGPATAGRRLATSFGLALRLQRGSLISWAIGLFATGVAYGSIIDQLDSLLADNDTAKELIAQAGGVSITDSYLSTTLQVVALIATGYALQSALRLRTEENAGRVEPLLATPTSRDRWVTSHTAMSFVGVALVLVAGGLGTGLTVALITGDWGELPRLVGASLVYVPAVWLLAGLAVALFGLAPRAALAAWAGMAFCFVIGMFGELLDLPRWLTDLSPFQRTPRVPADGLTLLPVVAIAVVAAALTAAGMAGFRHRDVA